MLQSRHREKLLRAPPPSAWAPPDRDRVPFSGKSPRSPLCSNQSPENTTFTGSGPRRKERRPPPPPPAGSTLLSRRRSSAAHAHSVTKQRRYRTTPARAQQQPSRRVLHQSAPASPHTPHQSAPAPQGSFQSFRGRSP